MHHDGVDQPKNMKEKRAPLNVCILKKVLDFKELYWCLDKCKESD